MLNIVVHLESVRVTFHNFFDIPLGVIRILDQTRPLLIVLEHASGSWLASAEESYLEIILYFFKLYLGL